MKQIRTIAVGLAMLAVAAPMLAAQAPQQPAPAQQGWRARPGRGMAMHRLFRNITLTSAEKTRLKSVRAKYEPQLKQIRETMAPQLEAIRAARQKGDTAAAKAEWNRAAPQRAQLKALMQQARVDARAALEPEHRAQFDKNVASLEQRVAQFRRHGWPGGRQHTETKGGL